MHHTLTYDLLTIPVSQVAVAYEHHDDEETEDVVGVFGKGAGLFP